jgi:ATP-binding cassette subfamily B protein
MTALSRKRIPRTPDRPLAFLLYLLQHCPTRMKMLAVAGFAVEIVAIVADVLIASWVLGRIVGVIAESTTDNLWGRLVPELVLLAVLWNLRCFSFRLREWLERRYLPELMNTTRNLLFNRLIQQSQAFIYANFAGVLANHVRRAGDVVGGLRDKMQHSIIPLLVRFITAGALLWTITPVFSAFILFFVLIGLVVARKTARRWTALSTRTAETSSRLTGYIVDGITNLSAVRQNVGWREEQARMGRAHDDLTEAFNARLLYVSWFWGTFDVVMTFFFVGFMALVAYGWSQGNVSTGQLAMTVGLVTNLFGALASTLSLLSSKFDDIGQLQEALQKISTPLSVVDADNAPDLDVRAGTIEFRNVTFGYQEGQKLFDGLNLSVAAGEKVGLVGVSGAGKTTLCQLLLRAYDVQGGGIYIDGQNIADVTQDSLHAAIAVIPQEPVLFHRSLGDNIRYGRFDATRDEMLAGARAAQASEFIEKLPLQYDTLVGERGIKLSGGQRQRVAIARAIVKDSPILVLDEATSALDSETEKAIQAAMVEAMRGRTTIVVAHRLSTLSRMDRIVVMEEGRVIEEGTFLELKSSGGIFSRLWNLQAGGFLASSLSADTGESA